ncbi:phospholipid/cholesterol/gamma-HCH transport system ATP-binding protein [Balneicella halophila]|uniref:Phospholipid/cholesterol/gamma-HCH transport system ATP-binding protein n=1 Tax=Balneicella halophila TaxID=1537566 RepID=A0A7L4UP57_BALHA|nr:ATP-binding cassette domain-containing protein [Balneicella halophila]PVX50901.1 phospholipid/cholesterol/gamma-HCH transport system ATP-binding protein [Balneicella halophila]
MITIDNIHKSFDDHHVLKGISFEFETGKTNLIIGQSGSGKTVLLKSIVGLHTIDKGDILYDNRSWQEMTQDQRIELRTEMGMVFQGSALFDNMTVEENIGFPMLMYSKESTKAKQKRVAECIDRVNLTGSEDLYPSEISGGMQKRVAIARAIVMKPEYLFCDEPNSGLDPKTAIVIDKLIHEITKEYNITTIINTHDMNSVLQIGENILYLDKGEVGWKGDKSHIFNSENESLNEFVFASDLYQKLKEIKED